MPYDLFWHGEPSLYLNYIEAYKQKQKDTYDAEVNRIDYQAWLTGYYVLRAIAVNNPLVKGAKEYFKEPLLSSKNAKKEQVDSENMDAQTARDMAQFLAFGELAKAINKKRHENGG